MREKAGNHSREIKMTMKEKDGKYRTETTISENKFSLDKLSSQIKVTKERSGELEEVT